jgi:heme/copper-type cytochrome/quinol oxidase subunit 2
MESQPDVQLGKIFIVLWIGLMLFIIISIVVVYFNAKSETSSCDAASITNVEKSKESSMGRTPKLFIAFLAITLFAVSTMNLTYKINSFEKKVEKPAPSTSNLLGMIKNLQKNQTIEPMVPSAPPMNIGQVSASSSMNIGQASAPPENYNETKFLAKPSAPPSENN